ncbi:MAG: ferredoxin [Candidatus Diapherotrites archaeon]
MVEIKIVHDYANCIGCAACTAVAPEFWEMKGSKSHPKGAIESKACPGCEEVVIAEKDYAKNKEAADVCPVNVIHIEKDGKREI